MNRKGIKWLFAALVVMADLHAVEARAEKRVGILLFSEEIRYSDAQRGIMEGLRKDGFGEPAVKFIIENAGGNKAKAAEVAQKFAAAKLDMVIPIGTSAAIAVAREIRDAPVVFGMVFDPVEAKIARQWKSSGNNTTGASPYVPLEKVLNALKELAPVKRLAVLYTPGEKNSEIQLRDLQGVQAGFGIKVIPVPLSRREDVPQILPEVIRTADAIYLTGSSVVGKSVALIVEMATRGKVVTVTHIEDLAEQGALLGVCADPYAVGLLAGEKGAKVLRGAKPSSIPIEPLKKLDVIVNMRTAKAGQFRLPPSFMKSVSRVIE